MGVHICMVWCVTVFVCHCPATKVGVNCWLLDGWRCTQGVKGGHVNIVCVYLYLSMYQVLCKRLEVVCILPYMLFT